MARLIFIDTANFSDIKAWFDRGICDGVTTNQKLLAKEENISFKRRVLQICRLGKFPVSVELTAHDSEEQMVKEAKMYGRWHKNIVVKVPMLTDGLGLNVLSKLKKLNIKTNATLMVSFEQMLLAIKAQATFASIFYNRAKDSGYDPIEIIKRTKDFIDQGGYKSQIITGSIRNIRDVGNAFFAGSDIVTIPPKILKEMLKEEMTQKTVLEFDAAWKEFLEKQK